MNVTLLKGGQEYLDRMILDRARLVVSYVAFGSGSNYTLSTEALGFAGDTVATLPIDMQSVDADTSSFTVVVPREMAFSYGELALVTATGIFLAATVLSQPLVKTAGAEVQITLTLNSPPFSQQIGLVTNRVKLSTTRPDFDDLVVQLQAAAVQTGTLDGLVTNETGNTLIELMAGAAEFGGYQFESALQEAFPDTAKLDSSQYAIQVMLRNRLTRKTPAGGIFSVVRPTAVGSFIVPAYSTWVANGVPLFNRESFQFAAGQATIQARLYEGSVVRHALHGLGTDYQFWNSTVDQFNISDTDVKVWLNTTSIPVVQDPLWNYTARPAVQDATDKYGKLVLSFGNLNIGSRPKVTDVINIMYVTTSGVQGNNSDFIGQKAVCSALNLNATALTNLSGGGNQPSTTLYQRMGGDLYAGQNGCVTPSQYRAKAREYPGVLDAMVQAQRDLSPLDKDWFNVAKVILLTATPWTDADRTAFESWYRARTQYSMRYLVLTGETPQHEPKPRMIGIKAHISCRNDSDLAGLRNKAETAVRKLFVPRAGILSRNLYRSDIINAIKDVAPELIDFVELDAPVRDVIVDLRPPNIAAQTYLGGSLPPGEYSYMIASVDADGVSVPSSIDVTVTEAGSSIVLAFTPVPAATSYIIYGRKELFEIGRVPAGNSPTITWVDDGSITQPVAFPPSSISTSGVHYATINTLIVTSDYSRRSAVEERGYAS